jgi:hypothetical protein
MVSLEFHEGPPTEGTVCHKIGYVCTEEDRTGCPNGAGTVTGSTEDG